MAPIELLVVDDNAAETLLLLYALKECPRPVKFHFAKDGVEALQMMGEQEFDLVILDLNLPKRPGKMRSKRGYSVCRQTRRMPANSSTNRPAWMRIDKLCSK